LHALPLAPRSVAWPAVALVPALEWDGEPASIDAPAAAGAPFGNDTVAAVPAAPAPPIITPALPALSVVDAGLAAAGLGVVSTCLQKSPFFIVPGGHDTLHEAWPAASNPTVSVRTPSLGSESARPRS
jgi:hypothetical protein